MISTVFVYDPDDDEYVLCEILGIAVQYSDGVRVVPLETKWQSPPKWGFNIYRVPYDAYDPAGETPEQANARLLNDYGTSRDAKWFDNTIPSVWSPNMAGIGNDYLSLCMQWAIGTIEDGSMDDRLTSFMRSVPSNMTIRFTRNEVDAKFTEAEFPIYKADMDYLYDFVNSPPSGVTAKFEVWDCFMQWALDAGSGPRWRDDMTNPAKRHGIIWDLYWNVPAVDKSGAISVGLIESTMRRLGMTRWVVGELGDRRPNSAPKSPVSDSARADQLSKRMSRLLTAKPMPESVAWFNIIGTTGDHRIIPDEDLLVYAFLLKCRVG